MEEGRVERERDGERERVERERGKDGGRCEGTSVTLITHRISAAILMYYYDESYL